MPLKLSVGRSQKVGLPNYGSIGASCQLEAELDPSLALADPSCLEQRIRLLQGICRQAVQEELALRYQVPPGSEPVGAASESPLVNEPRSEQPAAAVAARASQRQMDYVLQLARQVPAVGVAGLPRLAQHLFQKAPAELTSLEASSLIDVLKDLRGGKIAVGDALPGVAA